jgi:hypothetical protein
MNCAFFFKSNLCCQITQKVFVEGEGELFFFIKNVLSYKQINLYFICLHLHSSFGDELLFMLLVRAVAILEEGIPEAGLRPDAWSYAPIIGFKLTKNPVEAEGTLMDMLNAGVAPNSTIVDVLIRGSAIDNAISIAQHMFNQHGVRPTRQLFLKVMAKYMEVRRLSRAPQSSSRFKGEWGTHVRWR